MLYLFISLLLCNTVAYADSWVENTLAEMTVKEKIGQLFMIVGYVDEEYAFREQQRRNAIAETQNFITQYAVGGIALVGPSNMHAQVELLNRYQQESKYPLLVAQDFEWGLSMRLTDGMRFPKNSTLGVVQDNTLIYEMGKEIARQARQVGVHMNFSPDLDVNIEPENPVINVRSFGACPKTVAQKGIAMIRGLQEGGVIASAKHFPGLGDITTDPHLGLPLNAAPRARLEEVELYPFIQAAQAGVMSIQTDHVLLPAYDAELPSSLSPKIVQNILKDSIGYKGLVVSGALRMQALTKSFSHEEIAVKAFTAGSDMLLMPGDLPRAFKAIEQALSDGIITIDQINCRVRKILALKKQAGLDQKRHISPPTNLNTNQALALKKELYTAAVRPLRDVGGLLGLQVARAAYVKIGDGADDALFNVLNERMKMDRISIGLDYTEADELCKRLEEYPLVILAVFPADPRRIAQIRLMNAEKQIQELKAFHVHGLTSDAVKLLSALSQHQKKTIVTLFGNPFSLPFFDRFSTLIMGYEDDPDAVEAVAGLITLETAARIK